MANARKQNEAQEQEQVTREDDMLGKAADEDEFEDVDEVGQDDEEDDDSEDIDEDI